MISKITAVFQNIKSAQNALNTIKHETTNIDKAIITSNRNYYAVPKVNGLASYAINGNGVVAGLDTREFSAYTESAPQSKIFVGDVVRDYTENVTRDVILNLYINEDKDNIVSVADRLATLGAISVNYSK